MSMACTRSAFSRALNSSLNSQKRTLVVWITPVLYFRPAFSISSQTIALYHERAQRRALGRHILVRSSLAPHGGHRVEKIAYDVIAAQAPAHAQHQRGFGLYEREQLHYQRRHGRAHAVVYDGEPRFFGMAGPHYRAVPDRLLELLAENVDVELEIRQQDIGLEFFLGAARIALKGAYPHPVAGILVYLRQRFFSQLLFGHGP